MGSLLTVSLSKPAFSSLVWAVYAKARYRVGDPISCTLRRDEIELDADFISRILGVLVVGLSEDM